MQCKAQLTTQDKSFFSEDEWIQIDYVEEMIGGKRSKEWKLRSKCTC